MLKHLFANAATVSRLEEQVDTLSKFKKEADKKSEKALEQFEATIGNLRKGFTREKLQLEDYIDRLKFEHSLEVKRLQLKDDVADARKEEDERSKIAALNEKHRAEVSELKAQIRELELLNAEVGKDIDLAIREGILEARQDFLRELTTMSEKIARLEGQLEAAKAEGKSATQVVQMANNVLADYRKDFSVVMNKLATVSLDKFQINVDVPAPVTVNQKTGEQNKK